MTLTPFSMSLKDWKYEIDPSLYRHMIELGPVTDIGQYCTLESSKAPHGPLVYSLMLFFIVDLSQNCFQRRTDLTQGKRDYGI